jgi:hypothetical protein
MGTRHYNQFKDGALSKTGQTTVPKSQLFSEIAFRLKELHIQEPSEIWS